MTLHRDRVLVNKTNRCSEFQFLLVIIFLHILDSLSAHHQERLSRTTALVRFMQLGDRVLPGSGRNVVRLRSSWWWAERLPETCRVIITNTNWNSVHLLVLFTRNPNHKMGISQFSTPQMSRKFWGCIKTYHFLLLTSRQFKISCSLTK
jgi:hypothetical protein